MIFKPAFDQDQEVTTVVLVRLRAVPALKSAGEKFTVPSKSKKSVCAAARHRNC